MPNVALNTMANVILAKLEEVFPDLQVEHYPDNPQNFQLAHSKAAVLVTLADRTFDDPEATDGTGQVNSPVFKVVYATRSLTTKKENPGAYDLLDQGREALKGLDLGIGNLYIQKEGFVAIAPGGVWMHAQSWTHTDYFE